MKVSVAIGTYNRCRMVREAIAAALAQTLPPDEVVVSDDASTDATWETLGALARHDPRLKIFRRRRNSGGADNWNFAIGQTRGDYIAWCSDDDRFTPWHLQESIAYLESHPETGLVHSNFIDAIETLAGSAIRPRPLRFAGAQALERKDLPGYLTRYYDWPFHPSTLVFRRAVWDQVGPFNPAYALADTDWFVRAVERFPAAMLSSHGVYNRRHPGNWSNRLGSAAMQREIFEIVESAMDRLYAPAPLRRSAWKAVWRANVRLRLALTLRARLESGHGDAAAALWTTLARGTGRRLPEMAEAAGQAVIRRWCGRRRPAFTDTGGSVSPI